MTYEAGDVVVPFPFTDRQTTKRRPALVVSSGSAFNSRSGHLVLAMITSANNTPWPLDTITDGYKLCRTAITLFGPNEAVHTGSAADNTQGRRIG